MKSFRGLSAWLPGIRALVIALGHVPAELHESEVIVFWTAGTELRSLEPTWTLEHLQRSARASKALFGVYQ